MITLDIVLLREPGLTAAQVEDWVARGWIHAEPASPGGWQITEAEIERLHLLRDLQCDLALDPEALPVVLSLHDQLHSMRHTLESVLLALSDAPDAIREKVAEALSNEPPPPAH